MGFPRHDLFKKNKSVKSIVERFRDDCKKFENLTEDTSVKISFDGEKLRYSIKCEEHEIGFVTPSAEKNDIIGLCEEIYSKFEKIQIEMTTLKFF